MAGHRHGPGRIPEKPKNFKGTLRKLLRCLGAYRFALALVLVLALASTAFGIVGPKILSTATTELATGLGRKLSGLGGIDFGKIGKILLTVLALYLVSAACSFFQSWILAGVTQKLAYRLRGEISSKIHRMPMRYFERNTVGDVLSRITNDVDTMSSGYGAVGHAAGHERHAAHRRAGHDAAHQLAHDAHRAHCPAGYGRAHKPHRQAQPALFCRAAEKPSARSTARSRRPMPGIMLCVRSTARRRRKRSLTPSTRGSIARRGRASFCPGS